MTLPDDGETARARKTLGTAVLFAGSIGLFMNAGAMVWNGLPFSVAWYAAAFALFALLGGILILFVPKTYGFTLRLFLLSSILFNVGKHRRDEYEPPVSRRRF